MLPVVLRPAPGEGISARLDIPKVVKVPRGAPVGKNLKEAQELNRGVALGCGMCCGWCVVFLPPSSAVSTHETETERDREGERETEKERETETATATEAEAVAATVQVQ